MDEREGDDLLDELVALVVQRLDQGVRREAVEAELCQQGLPPADASWCVQRIVDARHQARSQRGTKDLVLGAVLVLIGSAITLGTWAAAGPGGTYFVTWSALAFGGFYILRGLFLKITTGANVSTTVGWLIASAILLGGAVGASIVAYNSTVGSEQSASSPVQPAVPPDSAALWTEDEPTTTAAGRATFSGRVNNLDREWSISKAKAQVTVYDAAGRQIDQFEIAVSPVTMPPGGEGTYAATRLVPASSDTYGTEFSWEWAFR